MFDFFSEDPIRQSISVKMYLIAHLPESLVEQNDAAGMRSAHNNVNRTRVRCIYVVAFLPKFLPCGGLEFGESHDLGLIKKYMNRRTLFRDGRGIRVRGDLAASKLVLEQERSHRGQIGRFHGVKGSSHTWPKQGQNKVFSLSSSFFPVKQAGHVGSRAQVQALRHLSQGHSRLPTQTLGDLKCLGVAALSTSENTLF